MSRLFIISYLKKMTYGAFLLASGYLKVAGTTFMERAGHTDYDLISVTLTRRKGHRGKKRGVFITSLCLD